MVILEVKTVKELLEYVIPELATVLAELVLLPSRQKYTPSANTPMQTPKRAAYSELQRLCVYKARITAQELKHHKYSPQISRKAVRKEYLHLNEVLDFNLLLALQLIEQMVSSTHAVSAQLSQPHAVSP